MLQKIDIQGVHLKIDEKTEKYVYKKLGHIDKYLPSAVRESAHAEIQLKESKAKSTNRNTCEITLYLPKETINIKESTINMFAAIDIVESKVIQKIHQYKDLHHSGKFHRRLMAKFRRQKT